MKGNATGAPPRSARDAEKIAAAMSLLLWAAFLVIYTDPAGVDK